METNTPLPRFPISHQILLKLKSNQIKWKWNNANDPDNGLEDWADYPTDISNKIEDAFNNDLPKIDIYDKYFIDLHMFYQISKEDPNRIRQVKRTMMPRKTETQKNNFRSQKKTDFLNMVVNNKKSLSPAIRDYQTYVEVNLMRENELDWKKLLLEIVEGINLASQNIDLQKKYSDFDHDIVLQAKEITSSLKSSISLKELHLAAIKVYSTESFLYREINNFLLDYEKLKFEKEKNLKDFENIFKSYAPFSWFLDQTLKLTPMSKDNIWEPREEVECSNTEYKIYRSVALDEETLKFYNDAFYSNKIKKTMMRDIFGQSNIPELEELMAGIYNKQEIFYWEGFSSTTQDISILSNFGGNVHFYIRACAIREQDAPISSLDRTKLKLIMHKSMRRDEEEVLLPPGITFMIDRIKTIVDADNKRKLTKIYITLNPESDFIPDKKLIQIKKSSYNLKFKNNLKKIISFVEDKLQKRDINLFQNVLIYATKKKSIFCLNSPEFQITKLKQGSVLPMKFLDNADVFNENMEYFFEKDNLFQLRCSFLPGDEFVPFTAEDLFSKDKNVLIKIGNEPLCIIFWSIKKLSFMKSIYDYLKLNKVNLPKIGIIFVNLDWGIFSIGFNLKKLIEKCFPDAQKIFGKDTFYGNIDNFSTYSELKPPNILIVDKNGKVMLCEEEKNFNLLSKLSAVQNPDFFKIFPNKVKTEISRKDYLCLKLESKKPEFLEAITELKKSFQYSVGIIIYGKKQRTIRCVTEEEKITGITSANERSKKYYQPTAIFTSEMRDCEDLTPFREFFNKFKINLKENVGSKIIKTVLFEKGYVCDICKTKITSEQAHYYCPVCNLYYCENCGNKTNPKKKGNSKYLDTHNLIFINIPLNESIEGIDVYKLGNNKQFKEDKTDFGFKCNICLEEPKNGFRWICLNCRPGPYQEGGFVDFCSKCMEIIQSKENTQQKKEFLKKLETEEGHNNNKHIYLRICFGDSYYNY